jgi:glycosyltransferase involved in cell wall biosynthesis
MEKMIFSCNWGNKNKAAWSGTVPGLYGQLQKYYEVERFDINVRHPLLVLFRCLERLGLGRFDMVYMRYYTRVFAARYKKMMGIKVFQFDECPAVPWAKSYIFQDLSVGFLLDVYENRPELIPYCGLENLSYRYLKKRVRSQRAFYRNAAGIFTMGQWLADYLVEHEGLPREKVHAVGGGVNVDVAGIDDSKRRGNRILFIGRDYKRKGGDLVVKAFRILKERMPDAELYVAGPSINPIAQEDWIEGIFFLGEQSAAQIQTLYNKCDIFCMPSRFEAYGLVFAEALVCGLPCIARNDFAMKEMICEGQNGYLIDGDDIQQLAEKMEAVLTNEQMKRFVRSQREEYIHKYSWESVVKQIADIVR